MLDEQTEEKTKFKTIKEICWHWCPGHGESWQHPKMETHRCVLRKKAWCLNCLEAVRLNSKPSLCIDEDLAKVSLSYVKDEYLTQTKEEKNYGIDGISDSASPAEGAEGVEEKSP